MLFFTLTTFAGHDGTVVVAQAPRPRGVSAALRAGPVRLSVRACAPAVTPVVMMMMVMVAGHDGSVVVAQGHRGHGEY